MVRTFEFLWDSLTFPLAWLPTYCRTILGVVGSIVVLILFLKLLPYIINIVKSIAGVFVGG